MGGPPAPAQAGAGGSAHFVWASMRLGEDMANGRVAFSARVFGWLLVAVFGLSRDAFAAFGFANCPQYVDAMAGCQQGAAVAAANGFTVTECDLKSFSTSNNSGIVAFSRKCAACSSYEDIPTGFSCSSNPCAAGQKNGSLTSLFIGAGSDPTMCIAHCALKPTGVCTSASAGSVSGKFCGWYTNDSVCDVSTPPPEHPADCMDAGGGRYLCHNEPQFCLQAEGKGTVCVPAPPDLPPDPCAVSATSALCVAPNSPPDPPIQHQPDYNPNPPPPDVTINIDNRQYHYYGGGSSSPPGPGQGGGDPPNSGRCGTAGNPPCPPPSPCGQPGKPPCSSGGGGSGGIGAHCGHAGEPVCDEHGEPACGVPGRGACASDGTPSCGVQGKPPCGSDGGPACGVVGKPQCSGDGTGPVCGIPGKPDCQGGNTGSCGGVGQPPCASCGGQGQPACSANCGTPGNPPCSGECGGAGQPECHTAAGGGDCAAAPVCAGEQILCSVLYQQWKTRCGIQDLQDLIRLNDYDPTNDDAGISDQADSSGFFVSGAESITSILSADGWLGGGACPTFGSVYVLDTTINLDSPFWCQVLDWCRVFLQASAVMASLRVLMR